MLRPPESIFAEFTTKDSYRNAFLAFNSTQLSSNYGCKYTHFFNANAFKDKDLL